MEYLLLQAVFLPLLLSPLAYIIGRRLGHTAATWFTFGLLLYCTILIIAASVGETYEEHYPWTELFGEFGLLLDGLAAPFAIMIYVLCTILALYSKPYMLHKFQDLLQVLFQAFPLKKLETVHNTRQTVCLQIFLETLTLRLFHHFDRLFLVPVA